jgi:hypothetical protein
MLWAGCFYGCGAEYEYAHELLGGCKGCEVFDHDGLEKQEMWKKLRICYLFRQIK